MIKILATSDLHGYLPEIKEEFDLFLICGDICPAHDHYYAFQIEWFENKFIPWVKQLPFKNELSKVVMIGGNHDFFLENMVYEAKLKLMQMSDNRLQILEFDLYQFSYYAEDNTINYLNIFGSSLCKRFGNWAFMYDTDRLRMFYENIPENIDILITHDAPTLGNLGLIQKGRNEGLMVGNIALDEIILKRKPKYVFCGHIHTGNHILSEIEGVKMCNVSIKDEYYEPVYEIFKFEY